MERSVDGMDEQNIFRRIDPANRPIQLITGLCLLAYSVAGPFLPTQGWPGR